jgi:site-specific DNA-adenine methylase
VRVQKYIKSPFNWVGNKYKYLDTVNELIKHKKYNNVYELFLGSGNLILNLQCDANSFIGSDKVKLVPKVYNEIPKYTYTLIEVENILNKFNRFSSKEDYYLFRDYWNQKYLNDVFDKEFIIETCLLLKMCSNSMVRFNPKEGYFNQGFRGLGNKKEFFTDTMKGIVVDGLNELSNRLQEKQFTFINKNFSEYQDENADNLLILDPPYILRQDMYDTDFTKELDIKLLDLIRNTKNDFIYFNYLQRDGVPHKELIDLIEEKGFSVININNKTLAGQGRSQNIREVTEVIVTNVKR